MIKPGLVSITFRQLSVEEIVNMVKLSGVYGIEWGGDVHVPHGNIETAKKVGQITLDAGLEVAAYGSYYKVAESERQGLFFDSVLDTADALGAEKIRVWAGKMDAEDASEDYWNRVVEDSRRIADMAAQKGILVVYEFHSKSLTNTYESCKKLLECVDHSNIRTYWQPLHGAGVDVNCRGLKALIPWVSGVHVFHWRPGEQGLQRYRLEEGKGHWREYFNILKTTEADIFGLIEFVKDDLPEYFVQDAATLKSLVGQIQ